MTEVEVNKLPWDYWVYQVLAVVGLVPGFLLTTLTLQQLFEYSVIFDLFQLPIIVSLAIVVIYTVKRLKEGLLPSAASYMTFYLTKYSPPQKIHRIILGSVLFEISTGLTIGTFQLFPIGLGWISWIGVILLFVFLVVMFTAIRIPDQPPSPSSPRDAVGAYESEMGEQQSRTTAIKNRYSNIWIALFFALSLILFLPLGSSDMQRAFMSNYGVGGIVVVIVIIVGIIITALLFGSTSSSPPDEKTETDLNNVI